MKAKAKKSDLKRLQGSIGVIVGVARNHDKRLIPVDVATLIYLAKEIAAGRRNHSNESIGASLRVCLRTVQVATRRLRWSGYVRTEERPAGSSATRYHLDMPFELRWDLVVPREPRLDEIPLSRPQQDFDADAHRAIGVRLGFNPAVTDQLVSFRQSLRK